MAIQPIDISTTKDGEYAGPMQESIFKTIYLLVQQAQTAKKNV
jgi:hypothetical protein